MNKTFNFAEKCFALFCKKNILAWGTKRKDNLSQEELMSLQLKEWKEYWNRFCSPIPDFRNKTVVDYGCGYGYDSLFAFQNGAKHVYCLEISETRLKHSEELHTSHGFGNATYIDNTNVSELPRKIKNETVDIIFSRDVIEHVSFPFDVLDSMYSIIKPEGEVYIGFSPFYKSPYGPHFRSKCKYPWIHLIFSEKTILNVFKELCGLSKSINSYQDIEGSGVNKLSYFDYKRMIDSFKWKREIDLTNRFQKRPLLTITLGIFVKTIPFKKVKELFLINSYVKLRKSIK